MRAVLALFLAAILVGCATSTTAPARAAAQRASFFRSTMTLAPTAEPQQSAVRAGAFFQRWEAGADYPTFVADPLGYDALVTKANVTLYLRATGPVVESHRFPDIMVYGGSGEAWIGFGSRTDYTAFLPGQVYEVQVELGLPPGGMWLPPDKGFGLKVVPVMLQQDNTSDIEILVGGPNETASRVDWATTPIAVPPATPTRGSATGEVTGTIYAGAAAPSTTSQRTPLALGANTTWVVAWMNTTSNVGIPDIDLSIVYPNGTAIATSGTPTPREAIRVTGPNLAGPGEYGLVVTTAGSPRAQYSLEWYVASTP